MSPYSAFFSSSPLQTLSLSLFLSLSLSLYLCVYPTPLSLFLSLSLYLCVYPTPPFPLNKSWFCVKSGQKCLYAAYFAHLFRVLLSYLFANCWLIKGNSSVEDEFMKKRHHWPLQTDCPVTIPMTVTLNVCLAHLLYCALKKSDLKGTKYHQANG